MKNQVGDHRYPETTCGSQAWPGGLAQGESEGPIKCIYTLLHSPSSYEVAISSTAGNINEGSSSDNPLETKNTTNYTALHLNQLTAPRCSSCDSFRTSSRQRGVILVGCVAWAARAVLPISARGLGSAVSSAQGALAQCRVPRDALGAVALAGAVGQLPMALALGRRAAARGRGADLAAVGRLDAPQGRELGRSELDGSYHVPADDGTLQPVNRV